MRRRLLPTLALLLLVGCGLGEPPADFSFLNVEPESLDPALCSDQAGGRIALNLFEGLTVRDPRTLEPRPGMAERWERSEDGLVWTFHLREAQWSDGRPLTSEDFRWSWTRLLDPSTAGKYANLLYAVRGARAFNAGETSDPTTLGLRCPDPRTFQVTLVRPVAYFLDLCAFYPLLPVPRRAVEAHGDGWVRPGHIVSNGAYRLVDWQINRRIRLRKNPRYWNAAAVELEIVDALPGDYVHGNFNRYESGLLDWVDASGVPLSLVDRLRERPDWHSSPLLSTYLLRFNVTRPPLDDPRVRKALALAADPRPICERVLRGGQQPAHSLVPPGLPGYEEVRLPGHRPEEARRLLAEAGYPDGEGLPPITLLFNTSEANKQVAEVLQQQWQRTLGIDLRLQNQEWKVFTTTVGDLDYDIARGSWIGDYADPNTFLDIWVSGSGNNRTGFASARYDSLIERAATTLDAAERMRLLRRCEEIVTEEACIVLPLYYYVITNLFDGERWEGLTPNLLNTLDLKQVRRRRTS